MTDSSTQRTWQMHNIVNATIYQWIIIRKFLYTIESKVKLN